MPTRHRMTRNARAHRPEQERQETTAARSDARAFHSAERPVRDAPGTVVRITSRRRTPSAQCRRCMAGGRPMATPRWLFACGMVAAASLGACGGDSATPLAPTPTPPPLPPSLPPPPVLPPLVADVPVTISAATPFTPGCTGGSGGTGLAGKDSRRRRVRHTARARSAPNPAAHLALAREIERNADDSQTVTVMPLQGNQLRHLAEAGGTPGRPEVNQHYLSTKISESNYSAGEVSKREIRR